jgi:hypothetical protein
VALVGSAPRWHNPAITYWLTGFSAKNFRKRNALLDALQYLVHNGRCKMSQMMHPPEGERPDQIDTQLNKLFLISNEIKLAQIKGDAHGASTLIADGLAQSCQLLQRLERDDLLKSVTPSEVLRFFEELSPCLVGLICGRLLTQTRSDP